MYEQQTTKRRGWSGLREPRPRIRPPRSRVEIACLFVVMLGMVALLAMTAYWWPTLPTTIAAHFDINGRPNAYGSKDTILFLPALLLLLTVLFTALSRYPWLFNYPVVIAQENAARNYQRGRTLLAVVNAFMACIFAIVQWQTIQAARGAATSPGKLFSPTFVIIIVVLIPLAAIILIVWWWVRSE